MDADDFLQNYRSSIEYKKLNPLEKGVFDFWLVEAGYAKSYQNLWKQMINFYTHPKREERISISYRTYTINEFYLKFKNYINELLNKKSLNGRISINEVISIDYDLDYKRIEDDYESKFAVSWYSVEEITKQLCKQLFNFYQNY